MINPKSGSPGLERIIWLLLSYNYLISHSIYMICSHLQVYSPTVAVFPISNQYLPKFLTVLNKHTFFALVENFPTDD